MQVCAPPADGCPVRLPPPVRKHSPFCDADLQNQYNCSVIGNGTKSLHLCSDRQLLSHNGGEVKDTLGVAPFVVVPHDHLHKVLTHNHGERGIN